MSQEDSYNPSIHCCPYWYKDFCDCTKKAMRESKKQTRDAVVAATIKKLNKHNIQFKESGLENVVEVQFNGSTIYLSLKPKDGKVKYRYKGNAKWYASYLNNFLKQAGASFESPEAEYNQYEF